MTNIDAKLAGPFTKIEAERLCRAVGMRKARLLDPEAAVPQYPIPHTSVVGKAPADLYTHPERYGTHYITAPFEGRAVGDFYFEVTPGMGALSEGTEYVDGVDVPITRAGTVRTADTFKEDDPDPDVRVR